MSSFGAGEITKWNVLKHKPSDSSHPLPMVVLVATSRWNIWTDFNSKKKKVMCWSFIPPTEQWCRNGMANQDIRGAENKQMASLHPSCSTLAGNTPCFPKLLHNYCFGFPMGRAPSSKLDLFHWEFRSLFFRALYTEQDAHMQVLTLSALSSEELQEFKWAHVCSRRKETNTNRPSNLLSPHLQSCLRVPCPASSKFSLRTRHEEEEEEEEGGGRELSTYQSHFEDLHLKDLSPLGPNIQELSNDKHYLPQFLASLIFHLLSNYNMRM